MPLSMYMGQPLHGQKPNIAIDLFDNSLSNLAPSYLTAKLNEKIMCGLTDKSCTIKISEDGKTIVTNYDDGTRETLTASEDESSYINCVYSKTGVLLKRLVMKIDDATGTIRNDVTYDGSVNGIVDFATATWDEIGVMLTRHYTGDINLANFWGVGDIKTITYNAIPVQNGVSESHASLTQKIVILGFDHDTITGGSKSAITIGLLNGISKPGYIHNKNSNVGGWAESDRRAWCNDAFFTSLPEDLRRLIKPVNKLYTAGSGSTEINTCSDKCFLLSESEIFGSQVTHSFTEEGDQYPYFIGGDTVRKKQGDDVAGYDNWFTRSSCKNNSSQYIYIESDGDANVCDANSRYQIIPAFCI